MCIYTFSQYLLSSQKLRLHSTKKGFSIVLNKINNELNN